jgi:hypothetical protein
VANASVGRNINFDANPNAVTDPRLEDVLRNVQNRYGSRAFFRQPD